MLKNILILISLGLFISCSTNRPSGKTEAEVLYKEALDMIKEKRYILATERLNLIRSQYPYSYYATHAELLNADVLFLQSSYAESAAAYSLFKDLHPKYKNISYVVSRQAESYYKQLPPTFDRDLSVGTKAIEYFQEILQKYPQSEYAKGAKEKIVEIKSKFKKKEKYIADFYFRTKEYFSARYRYLRIIKNFSDEDLKAHAMVRVVTSSKNLNEKEKCTSFFKEYELQIKKERLAALKSAAKTCF